MPKCSSCKLDLAISEFRWRDKAHTRVQSKCISCSNSYANKWYEDNKPTRTEQIRRATKARLMQLLKEVNEFKSLHGCTDCGERDPIVLEFDHLRDKVGNVATMIYRVDRETLWKEIDKCEVVCANCHRRRTHKRRGSTLG